MQSDLTVTYAFSDEAINAGVEFLYARNPGGRAITGFISLAVMVNVALSFNWLDSGLLYFSGILMATTLCCFFVLDGASRFFFKKLARDSARQSNADPKRTVTLTLQDDLISIDNEFAHLRLPYQQFRGMHQNESYLFLLARSGECFAIPRNAFITEDSCTLFVDTLRSKLMKK